MLTKYKIIMLLGFSLSLVAQNNEKANSLFKQELTLNMLTDSIPNSWSTINSSIFYFNNNFKHAFTPKKGYGLELKTAGLKKLKKHNVYGSFTFKEQHDDNSLGKNTFTHLHLSPFFLSDTIFKDWKTQRVFAQAGISKKTASNLKPEIQLDYITQHKVNQQSPKTLLYNNLFSIKPRINYSATPNLILAIEYVYSQGTTETDIDDGIQSNAKIFSVTGVGNLESNTGGASNFRLEEESYHGFSFFGKTSFKNNILNFKIGLQRITINGYDNQLKTALAFNYKEWFSYGLINFYKKLRNKSLNINYNISYRNGDGVLKNSFTYTEKLNQQLKISLLDNKQKITLTSSHIHKNEANSVFANYYDIDYLNTSISYFRKIDLKHKQLNFKASIGYQTPIHFTKRIIKTNHFITNFFKDYLQFNNQNFYLVNFTPSFVFNSNKKLQTVLGIHYNFNFNKNTINSFNAINLKLNF